MKKQLLQALFAAVIFLPSLSASAQSNVLHIPTIGGESVVAHHTGDIDMTSFAWSVSIPISGGVEGQPTFTDISITKLIDKSSPTLALKCASAASIGTVTIYCTESSSSGQTDFYKIVLSNCLVSSVQVNSPPGAVRATEMITLHFTNIQWSYIPLDSSGNPQAAVVTQYP